ncbi:MAG: hypothetical protein ACI9WC_002970 [Arenicella sp.]|jgi:hypothetical protein
MNKYLIVFLASYLLIGSSLVLGEERSFSRPQLISKTKIPHPDINYNERKENASYDSGIVELIYMVDERGNPTEISVLRSSLKKFEAAAIESIQTHFYEPAIFNGKPVSSVLTSNIVFEINRKAIAFDRWYLRNEGLRQDEEFSRLYGKLKSKLVKTRHDFKALNELLGLMSDLRSRSFKRLVNISLAKLQLAETFDLTDQRIVALQELLWYESVKYEGKNSDPTSTLAIRKSLLKLLIDNGRYSESLSLYTEAIVYDPVIKAEFGDYIAQIEVLANNDSTLGRIVGIPISGKAGVPLLKRTFTFDNISGRLTLIKLRCGSKFAELAFKTGAEYRVPSSWGACNLEIIGETETVARLLEF